MMWLIWRVFTSTSQMAEENWASRSDVIVSGTPKRAIQPETNASGHDLAEVEDTGMTSTHLVERSIIVKRCVWPSLEAGSGPTKSTWMWEKRRPGTGMVAGGVAIFPVTFPRPQCWQSRHQAAMSLPMLFQTNLEVTRR